MIPTKLTLVLVILGAGAAAHSADQVCAPNAGGHGEVRAVAAAAVALQKLLTPAERAAFARPFDRESVTQWSNLPVGIVARAGVRLGDLDAKQSVAAHNLAAAALSACGIEMLDEIRLADDFLTAADKRGFGWTAANYYMSVLGNPSKRTPWMLQIGGHHIAYNFTFNGKRDGATPLFFGTEPIRFSVDGVEHEPLKVQSTAMSDLGRALSSHAEAKLSGTFTDVVKGVVVVPVPGQFPKGGTDSGYPRTYPEGTQDRGILVNELPANERALVRAALESYASLPGDAITHKMVGAYEDPAAFAQTYVGYAGDPALSERGGYVRIDGPRIWMEFVVQPAVANPAENHYHALWRDKQSDYGGEIGK